MLIWQAISLLYKLSIVVGALVVLKLLWSLVVVPIIRAIKRHKEK